MVEGPHFGNFVLHGGVVGQLGQRPAYGGDTDAADSDAAGRDPRLPFHRPSSARPGSCPQGVWCYLNLKTLQGTKQKEGMNCET